MPKTVSRARRSLRLGLLLLLLIGLVVAFRVFRQAAPTQAVEAKAEHDARAAMDLAAREETLETTVWSRALDAGRHEDVFLNFWDSLNRTTNKLVALGTLPFQQLRLAGTTTVRDLPHGIHEVMLGRPGTTGKSGLKVGEDGPTEEPMSFGTWFALLARWQAEGWRVERTSWRQIAFAPPQGSTAARSVIAVTAQAANETQALRLTARGELDVEWQAATTTNAPPVVATINARQLKLLSRRGPPLFRPWLDEEVVPSAGTFSNDPLLVHDLDGDGRPELVLVGANRVWWNLPPGPVPAGQSPGPTPAVRWQSEPLATLPESQIFAAVLAPLSAGDRDELICAVGGGVLHIRPDKRGRFSTPPEALWEAPEKLRHPQVLTVGDIDGDGDLDVFLGQYKLPYHAGQMPTPYYDANDGFPSYLLRNDGGTNLIDITAGSGLAPKSHRRIYSSSLVDLDGDGDLDLVLICDFSGVDLFLNDGRGRFTDVTAQLGDDRHLAGMAHALGDFNGDGRLDLLAIGMDSPTAATLDSLGLGRADFPEHTRLRPAITFGNRLFLGDGRGGFRQAPFVRELARTGWTWGVTAFDLENDGDPDFYFANGHETYASVTDYERQFWLHDIYVASSRNDPVTQYYFRTAGTRRREAQASFGGWQDNALLLNATEPGPAPGGPGKGEASGVAFHDIAFLAGVSVSADSRNVVSEDLDGDGRTDLIATTFELWPQLRQRLLVFHNETPAAGHWIGFRCAAVPPGRSAIGGRVVIETGGGSQTRWLVTGDGYRTQHSQSVHFGLGGETAVKRADLVWPDGHHTALENPRIDQWHWIGR